MSAESKDGEGAQSTSDTTSNVESSETTDSSSDGSNAKEALSLGVVIVIAVGSAVLLAFMIYFAAHCVVKLFTVADRQSTVQSKGTSESAKVRMSL